MASVFSGEMQNLQIYVSDVVRHITLPVSKLNPIATLLVATPFVSPTTSNTMQLSPHKVIHSSIIIPLNHKNLSSVAYFLIVISYISMH